MLGLIPRPWLILAMAAAFALSNGVSFYRGWHTGAKLAELRHMEELAAAQAEATLKQQVLAGGVQRAAEEAYNAQVDAEAHAASADAAVDRLRQAVASANIRAGAAAAAAANGQTARALLADCAGRYRDVAREADRLRATVIGLQGYARAVAD